MRRKYRPERKARRQREDEELHGKGWAKYAPGIWTHPTLDRVGSVKWRALLISRKQTTATP
jgi:hypothetical protein